MKIYKKFSGINADILSDVNYRRLLTLTGAKTPASRVVPSFEVEEASPQLAAIEQLLKDSGFMGDPISHIGGPADWDKLLANVRRTYFYEFRRDYDYEDLAKYQYAILRCPEILEKSSDTHGDLEFKLTATEILCLMDADVDKFVVSGNLAMALREEMGQEADFVKVTIKKKGKLLDQDCWWVAPKKNMPSLSRTKNRFYNFDGKFCEYGNKTGFSVFSDNFSSAEFVYDRTDFPQAGIWKFAQTKEALGFRHPSMIPIWSIDLVKIVYMYTKEFVWYPVHLV